MILVIGGSLGAKTLNRSIVKHLDSINEANVQVLLQTGKHYYDTIVEETFNEDISNVKLLQFIHRMDLAYAAADIIISRAGAISVSELSMVGKPIILVPSPNVSEDHQTKNAMALVEKNAAILVKDSEARKQLIPEALNLLNNKEKQQQIAKSLKQLEKPNATIEIVDVCESIVERKRRRRSKVKSEE